MAEFSTVLDRDVWLPATSCTLPDGRTGWFQRGINDCLKAALATVLQVDYDDVPGWPPDPFADVIEQLRFAPLRAVLKPWLERRGLRMVWSNSPPFPDHPGRDVWIAGQSPAEGDTEGAGHAVVMAGRRMVFDPGWGFVQLREGGHLVAGHGLSGSEAHLLALAGRHPWMQEDDQVPAIVCGIGIERAA